MCDHLCMCLVSDTGKEKEFGRKRQAQTHEVVRRIQTE